MLSYYGGKFKQARMIIQAFPVDFTKRTYVEVFGGAGWVLFKKPPSKIEVYNDINSDLVCLFTTIRDNLDEFKRRAEWTLFSREMFKQSIEKLRTRNFIDEIDRALAVAVIVAQGTHHALNKFGWSGKGRSIECWHAFIKRLEQIKKRLYNVRIENLDWQECVKRYDSPNTLFYLDPPYIGHEHEYGTPDWTEETHYQLAETLKNAKAKWLLSYYDHPLIREWYKDFNIVEYKLTVKAGITQSVKPQRTELLILNYEIEGKIKTLFNPPQNIAEFRTRLPQETLLDTN